MQHGNDMQGLADTLRAEGEFFRTLPAHESARTPAANRRIEDRMMADAKALPPSGLRFWRFAARYCAIAGVALSSASGPGSRRKRST